MSGAMVASMGLPVLLSLIGQAAASGDRAEAERLRQQAVAQYGEIEVPQVEDIVAQQATASGDVATDGNAREAQLAALASLQNVANSGGMNAVMQGQIAKSRASADQMARGDREAVMLNRAQRGIGGGGDELASSLSAGQAAASRHSAEGMDAAAMAQRQALQAMMDGGQMAGNIRSQGFAEGDNNRRARDEMARFNTGLRQRTMEGNRDARGQRFGQQMQLAGAKAGQYRQNADARDGAADRTASAWGGAGAAAGKGVVASQLPEEEVYKSMLKGGK